MSSYTYNFIAEDSQGNLLPNASGSFYADTDSALVTPLTVVNQDGVSTTSPTSNRSGLVYFTHDTQFRGYWKAGNNTLRVSAWEAADTAAAAAVAAQAAAEAAAASAAAPTDAAITNVLTTSLDDPASDISQALTDAFPSRTNRAKHAPAFGLYFPEAEGAVFDGVTDDYLALIAAANTAASAGPGSLVDLPMGKTAYVAHTVTVPAGVEIQGHYDSSVIKTDQNIHILTPTGGGVRLRNVTLQGSLPAGSAGDAAKSAQMGIGYSGTVATRLQGLDVEHCKFKDFHAVAFQIIHGANINVHHCHFDQYASGGVWLTSVIGGDVSHNTFNGTGQLYLGTTFCYAVTATVSIVNGTLDDTVNPRSQLINITDNVVTNQAWECLDTHLGAQIKFANNQCYGPGAGVVAIGNDNAPMFSPVDITITGNTVVCPLATDSYGGVALIGAKIILDGSGNQTNTGRQLATGLVANNDLTGCYHDAQVSSGAVNVSNARGVPVIGNMLNQCRSVGIYLRNVPGAVVSSNTITDMWRSDAGSAAFYILRDTQQAAFTVTMLANRHIRGDLTGQSNINTVSIGGSSDASITLVQALNDLPGTINTVMTKVMLSAPLFAKTAADQTVNNSTTLVASSLAVALDPNSTYDIIGVLAYNASQAADAQVGWTVPTGATMQWTLDSLFTNVTSAAGTVYRTLLNASQVGIAGGPGSVNAVARPLGTITTSTTAGTLTLTFAQNTADATDTKLLAGSWIKLTKIA